MVDSGCATYRIHHVLYVDIFVGKVSFNKYDKNDTKFRFMGALKSAPTMNQVDKKILWLVVRLGTVQVGSAGQTYKYGTKY